MLVLWGQEHICFYNDAVMPSLGPQMHPAIGQPARDIWAEGWDFMGPLLAGVLKTGEPVRVQEAPVTFFRNGQTQTMYWTFSYSLIRDEAGHHGGVLVNGLETTQAVHTRQALGRSQQLFDNLFTSAPVAIALFDGPQFVIEQANELVLEYWGRSREQVIHRPLFAALPEAAGQGFEERLTKVYTTGERFIAKELTVTLERNGRLAPTYIDFVYEPVRQLDETVTGVLVICTEITEQVLARRKVEESEARFRSLIEEAPVATCLFVGPHMVIEMANEAMIGVWGKGPSVLGQPLAQALPELKEQHFLTTLDHLFRSGEIYDIKGGRADLVVKGVLSTYYFDYTFKPLRNQAGAVYAILETAIDVTKQVKTQQQLIASENRFRSIVEQAPMAIGLLSGREMVIEVGNAKIFDMWGKDESIKGLPISEALPELQGQVFTALLEGVYDTGEPYLGHGVLANLVRHGQLEDVYFDFVYTPLRDNDEQITGVMVLATEVTLQVLARQRVEASEVRYRTLAEALEQQVQQRTQELAAANQRLAANNQALASSNEEYAALNKAMEEANRLLVRSNDNLQTFAYVASHDLQEPLRKIQQFGDLLQKEYGVSTGNQPLDYLQRMQSAASRMSMLIKDLLNYSRLTTRRDEQKSLSLQEVVGNVLTDLELVVAETHAQIAVDPLPHLMGDASQLGQLFQNLISNALKFSRVDAGGVPVVPQIAIRYALIEARELPRSVKPVRLAEQYHRIEVADNGIGFEEKYLDRIFEVFQRLHGKNQFAGTGIGLAISERVVANHGGAITARSQPGQGATFQVYFPA